MLVGHYVGFSVCFGAIVDQAQGTSSGGGVHEGERYATDDRDRTRGSERAPSPHIRSNTTRGGCGL